MIETLSEQQIEALIRRHRQLGASVAELSGEMTAIKQKIDESVPIGWKFTVDGVTSSKREANREFDLVLAFAEMTNEEREACKVLRLDPKLVREAIVAKGKLEACMSRKPEAQPVTKL